MAKDLEDAEVALIDQQLLDAGIPLHARPFWAMVRVAEARGSSNVLASEIQDPVMASYRRLYPSGKLAVPSMLVGGAGFRDQFYLATVPVVLGTCGGDPLKRIQISPEELDLMWRLRPDEWWRAIYSVGDLWDLAYAVADVGEGRDSEIKVHWANTKAGVEATARVLASATLRDSVVQSACLTAELAMKAALAQLGVSEQDRRTMRHDLPELAQRLIGLRSTRDDDRLIRCVSAFPDYVGR